jgi:hypothetical protein
MFVQRLLPLVLRTAPVPPRSGALSHRVVKGWPILTLREITCLLAALRREPQIDARGRRD